MLTEIQYEGMVHASHTCAPRNKNENEIRKSQMIDTTAGQRINYGIKDHAISMYMLSKFDLLVT